METRTDYELLRELASGSHAAFSAIYTRYWDRVYLFAYDRLGDSKQSQDILQDVFVTIWERRETLEIDNLSAYLYTSVRNRILKAIDARQAKAYLFRTLEHFPSENPSADHQLISNELQTAYHAFMERMPPQRRRIFQMRHEESMKTREIAGILQLSQKTVQNHLLESYRGIRTLLGRVLFVLLGYAPLLSLLMALS